MIQESDMSKDGVPFKDLYQPVDSAWNVGDGLSQDHHHTGLTFSRYQVKPMMETVL